MKRISREAFAITKNDENLLRSLPENSVSKGHISYIYSDSISIYS